MTAARAGTSVLLSFQRALWDAVTPGLRGVAVRIGDAHVEGRMIYDHEPDDDEIETCSVVQTYIIADLPDDVAVNLTAVRIVPTEPRSLLAGEQWVYLPKGPAPPEPWHPHPNPAVAPLLDSPRTRGELASFVDDLARTITASPDAWENTTLPDFLHALGAWTRDLDGDFLNRGEPVPETPSWNLVAQMLLAATTYE